MMNNIDQEKLAKLKSNLVNHSELHSNQFELKPKHNRNHDRSVLHKSEDLIISTTPRDIKLKNVTQMANYKNMHDRNSVEFPTGIRGMQSK